MSDNGTQTKARIESKYARDEPEITSSGGVDSCGWNSCNTQVEDTV